MKDADVITTVAVAMETVFLEITPVIVFFGSSVWCVCAETMDVETDAAAAMAMIPAGSLSYCSCSVVDVAITVVAADIFGRQRLFPLPFLCMLWRMYACFFVRKMFRVFFLLFNTLEIDFIKCISIYNKFFFFHIQKILLFVEIIYSMSNLIALS